MKAISILSEDISIPLGPDQDMIKPETPAVWNISRPIAGWEYLGHFDPLVLSAHTENHPTPKHMQVTIQT